MLRLWLAALATLVLGAGCGGDPAPGADDADDAQDGVPKTELSLAVSWDGELVAGKPVTWALTVTNQRAQPLTLEFSSGQQGDVVLTTDDGSEAYRWSEERSFTGALIQHPLGAGASITFELSEEQLDVEPGSYRLTATVPSDPLVPPVEETATVG